MNLSRIFKVLVFAYLLCLPHFVFAGATAETAKPSDLRWNSHIIRIAFSSSLFQQQIGLRPGSDVEGALSRSLKTWESAANIKFVVSNSEQTAVSRAGKSGDGTSLITIAPTAENLIFFSGDAAEVPARTRVFFNGKGAITEADIVLNPYQQFSTDGSSGTFDLESTLTHEIGHLLGLEHTFIIGATMQAHQGRNGVYGLPATSARSLSEDDIAGVRSIYGPPMADSGCCGTIAGELAGSNSPLDIWIEDNDTGRVIAGTTSETNGKFEIPGVSAGNYGLYSRSVSGSSRSSADLAGNVSVEPGKVTRVSLSNVRRKPAFQPVYVGFSGQLSSLPIPVNGGKAFMIFVGGLGKTEAVPQFFFRSPFLSVSKDSIVRHDFSSELSVYSFEVVLKPETPFGDYSILVMDDTGTVDALPGAVSVGDVENSWNSFQIPVN